MPDKWHGTVFNGDLPGRLKIERSFACESGSKLQVSDCNVAAAIELKEGPGGPQSACNGHVPQTNNR